MGAARTGGLPTLAGMLMAAWTAVSCVRAGVFRAADPPPRHVRHTLVLDGQGPSGPRARMGLELVRSGTSDTLVLSGVEIGGGMFFSMVWARMLPLDPAERGRVLELRSHCRSTQDEARIADSLFQALGDDTVAVVTSDYHAWRTASVFRRLARRGVVFVVVPAPDPDWAGGFSTREGRKMRLAEWTKRAYWTLVEQWRPVGGDLPWHALARGGEVGVPPPPSWR